MGTAADRLAAIRRALLVVAGISGLLGFILEYGTVLGPDEITLVAWLRSLAVGLFLLELALAAIAMRPWRVFLATRWPALALTLFLAGELLAVRFGAGSWLAPFLSFFSVGSVTQAYVVVVQFYLVGNLLLQLPRLHRSLAHRSVRPGVAFLMVFLLLILAGAGLLLLPRAVPIDQPLSKLDALFTSTSAVCVTGLIVRDTATQFSPVGQVIILLLIQLGGLGIMSLTATLSLLLGKGIGIRESSLLREVLQIPVLGEVSRMIGFIALFTFLAEALGTVMLYFGFADAIGDPRLRLFYAVFHSISAFCNAGFCTFTDSLVGFADDGLVTGTVVGLLIIGGLGFAVVANLLAYWRGRVLRRGCGRCRLSVQTKVVLRVTALLLLASTLLVVVVEWNGGLAGADWDGKLGRAFFQAATTRTAGFNSLDLTALSVPTLFLMIVLMFVGGAPGSTAGGVKLTTVAIMWANLRAIGRGYPRARLFDREVPRTVVRRAMLVLTGGLLAAALGVFLLLLSEGRQLLPTAFEVFSALGTVGLSLGMTGELSPAGKVIITILMIVGRLGPLTLAYGLVARSRERGVRLPQARIMVG